MTTKQNDAVAMTEQQLDTVAGGSAFVKIGDYKLSPKSRFSYTENDDTGKKRLSVVLEDVAEGIRWHRT